MNPSQFRPDIEGLRAFAVLIVISSHLELGFSFLSGGFIGVDVFFVLSGYLITKLLIEEYEKNAKSNSGYGWISLRVFYFRRIRRLLPNATLVLTITIIYAYATLNSAKSMNVFREGLFALIFVANLYMIHLNTDYFQRGFAQSPFEHFWSLSVEEQFYLIMPSLFIFTTYMHGLKLGRFQLWWHRRLFILISLITVSSFAYSLYSVSVSPTSAYFSPFTRAWEIGVGSLLSAALREPALSIRRWLANLISILGFTFIIISSISFNEFSRFPGKNALIPVISAAALIFAGSADPANIVSKFLSNKVMSFIGRISYSLYLWHLPILVYGRRYFVEKNQNIKSELFLCLLIFIMAILAYHFVEKPIRRVGIPNSFLGKPRHKVRIKFGPRIWSRKTILNLILTSLTTIILLVFYLTPLDRSQHLSNETTSTVSKKIIPKTQLEISHKDTTAVVTKGSQEAFKNSITSTLGIQDLEVRHAQLKQLLRQSLVERKLPMHLIPTMLQLATRKGFQPELCSQNFCKFGNGPKIIAVVGNSFAQMIQPIITNAISLNQYTIYLQWRSGCQVAEMEKCADIFNIPRNADLIIVSDYTYGHDGLSNSDITYGLETNYRRLASMNKPVLIFAQPVYRSTTLLDCVDSSNVITVKCTSEANTVSSINNIKKNFANDNGFFFINPNEWICIDNYCPLVIGNYAVSVDNQHLSFSFSEKYLASEFRREMINFGFF